MPPPQGQGSNHPSAFDRGSTLVEANEVGHIPLIYGDFEDHDARYARTRDFLEVVRALWSGATLDRRDGRFPVQGAVVAPLPASPIPIYFGGHSDVAQQIAAELADVYLMWGDTVPAIAGRIRTMDALTERVGRAVRYGLRCHVIVRETEDEAWSAAERLISRIDPAVRADFRSAATSVDSEGQRRQLALVRQYPRRRAAPVGGDRHRTQRCRRRHRR